MASVASRFAHHSIPFPRPRPRPLSSSSSSPRPKPHPAPPPRPTPPAARPPRRSTAGFRLRHRLSGGEGPPDPPHGGGGEAPSFDLAVGLFNGGDYYGCHDALEELWHGAEDPIRTLLHGILQCAVGLHHLFNQNHRGAMMELGEGLCKLRKMGFDGGPFLQFEEEVSAVLEFVYQTQKELAACKPICSSEKVHVVQNSFEEVKRAASSVLVSLKSSKGCILEYKRDAPTLLLSSCSRCCYVVSATSGTDELCLAMDGSERSYQLLGSFAAGQQLYRLDVDEDGIAYIIFSAANHYSSKRPSRTRVPILCATREHLKEFEYKW